MARSVFLSPSKSARAPAPAVARRSAMPDGDAATPPPFNAPVAVSSETMNPGVVAYTRRPVGSTATWSTPKNPFPMVRSVDQAAVRIAPVAGSKAYAVSVLRLRTKRLVPFGLNAAVTPEPPGTTCVETAVMPFNRNESICPLNRTTTPVLPPGAQTALFTPGAGSVKACPVSVSVPVWLMVRRLTTLALIDVVSTEPSSHTSTELWSGVTLNVPTTARVAVLITAMGAAADPSLATRNRPSLVSARSSTNGIPVGVGIGLTPTASVGGLCRRSTTQIPSESWPQTRATGRA